MFNSRLTLFIGCVVSIIILMILSFHIGDLRGQQKVREEVVIAAQAVLGDYVTNVLPPAITEQVSPVVNSQNAESGDAITKFVSGHTTIGYGPIGYEAPVVSVDSCIYACRKPAPKGVSCLNCCYPIEESGNAK